MKKYLITGALALVACATLTSCHSDDELSGSLIEQKVLAYEEVFKQEFGFNPDHNWALTNSSRKARTRAQQESRTRTVYADGNEWAASDGQRWAVPPPLTDDQMTIVRIYFQNVYKPTYEDPHWTDYFMQQVYKGHTQGKIGSNSPEQYIAANGATPIIGSDHMDHLAAIDADRNILDHNNNFNHGDCGVYGNVLDYTREVQYTKNDNGQHHHADKINLMVNSTTKSFGYYNSDGTIRHTEYTGLVSWQTIKTWADENGHAGEADCLEDGWNRSFMGFDFEQMVGPELYENATFTFDGETYHFLRNNPNMYCADRNEKSYSTEGGVAHFNDKPGDDVIRDLLSKGYLPYTDTMKDWVKVGGCADGYYSDWIVCLTKAEHYGDNPNSITIPIEEGSSYWERTYVRYRYMVTLGESGRVICEDLGTANASDIDFNDIVFDGYVYDVVPMKSTRVTISLTENGEEIPSQEWSPWVRDYDHDNVWAYTLTDVYLLAGGGTIPVTVGGYKLKDVKAFNTSDKTLVNTVDDRNKDDIKRYGNTYKNDNTYKQPDVLKGLTGINNLNDINVIVQYGQQIYKLEAYQGAVPNKICVPIKTKWPYERIEINQAYDFNNYVKAGTKEKPTTNYTDNGFGRQELTVTVIDENGNEVEKPYCVIDDKYDEALWLNPSEDQKENLYHGEDQYYDGDGVDISDIPYASELRTTGLLERTDNDGLPTEDSENGILVSTVEKTYNGGYNNTDDPVLIRKRN